MGKRKPGGTRKTRSTSPLRRRIRAAEAVWLEGPVPSGFWSYSENRRNYLIWLGQQLGYRKLDDFYAIKTDDFKEHRGGSPLMNCWNSSSVHAVMSTFPDHDWKEWRFVSCPRGFWSERRNHRRYMEWLAAEIGIREPEDWYGITNQHFRDNKGGAFLLFYDSTVSEAVKVLLPEHSWEEWRFSRTPKNFWKSKANRVRYMKWLAKRLSLKSHNGWYDVTRKDFQQHHGSNLLTYYDGSPLVAAMDCFPAHKWMEWRFARVPRGFWRNKANRERYLEWLARRLRVQEPTDWNRIHRRHFKENSGGGLLAKYRSIELLKKEHGLGEQATPTDA